jgi:Cu(I)/Ag(I) efflux system membrane fusion protein
MTRKKSIIALLAIAVVVAGGYGSYELGRSTALTVASHGPAMNQVSGGKSNSPAAPGKKVLYWHDPMVPGQKFDKPGKSPFMDMQLVPVYADDASGDASDVKISPQVQQNLGIRTAEVTKGALSARLVAVGNVAYNDREVALVQARGNGYVERLYVRAPLDKVRKGQPLAELYVPDWVAAQEEYLSIQRMGPHSGMDGLLDGARQRLRLVGMTDDQIRLFASRGKVQPRLTVTAPITGVVSELSAREGMTVANGAPLFRINGTDRIWVNADVPENVSAGVRPGTPVEASTASLPGTVFKGKVGALLPQVSPATRTLQARIELANPSGELVPGMFATINFTGADHKQVLLVPTEAVIQTGTRTVVMVDQGSGKFDAIEVQIGGESNGQTEVVKGLEARQKVVVSGQFLIDSEASLKGSIGRMEAPQPSTKAAKPAQGPTHHGQGKVEKVDKDEITISHGPIPTLQWGPMTMGFKVPAGGLPQKVGVGDTVNFDIRPTADGSFEIAAIASARSNPAPKVGATKSGATGVSGDKMNPDPAGAAK